MSAEQQRMADRTDTSATAELWRRRDRRVPVIPAAAALTGADRASLQGAARVSFAASTEVEGLLASMADRVRSLPMALREELERCVHSVRGPVVWSETLTARANALGDEDVFVCRTVRRGFDGPENRLLVWLLGEVARAGRAVRGPIGEVMSAGDCRRVEEIAMAARRWRHHDRLVQVKGVKPAERELARSRHGRHARMLVELFEVRARWLQPFDGSDVEGLTDTGAAPRHLEALTLFDRVLASEGSQRLEGSVTFADGALRCGPASFRHPKAQGEAPPWLGWEGEPVDDVGALLQQVPSDQRRAGRQRPVANGVRTPRG